MDEESTLTSSHPVNDSSINRVSIKPPPFMENAVEGWFTIMEAQFHLQGITAETTRFFHVLAALPPNIVGQIPPSCLQQQNFSCLKSEVLQLFERSKPELFEALISTTNMTGKPSLFLYELQGIARKVGVTEELVRHKFTQALPVALGPVLAAQKELSLCQLGKLADELMPLTTTPCLAAPVSFPPRSEPHVQTSSTTPPTSKHQNFGLRPFHDGQRPKVCRGHIFFGTAARTCKPWCQWPSKSRDLRVQPSSRGTSPTRETTQGN